VKERVGGYEIVYTVVRWIDGGSQSLLVGGKNGYSIGWVRRGGIDSCPGSSRSSIVVGVV
jgi:hypothetical protein